MRKNRVFWGMLLFSAALHGLAFIGTTGLSFRAPSPVSQALLVSTVKMVKAGTPPPANAPSAPSKPVEKKPVKKPVKPAPELPPETPPEPPPVEEITYSEEAREDAGTEEASGGDSGEAPESGAAEGGVGDSGTSTNSEYEALLAYIKDFIDKNLVYPVMAKRRNVEGVVAVHFEIERNGGLAAVTVDHSSGSSILDNAAVSLVKKMPPPKTATLNRTVALNVNIEYKLTE